MPEKETGSLREGDSVSEASFLLDTSAILTLLEDEPGADRVQYLLRRERVLLPFVVSMEVYYITLQERGEDAAYGRYAMLKALEVVHLNEVRESVLLTAGRFKANYPISIADALIAAYAHGYGSVLVHKDPEYEALRDQVKQEKLPYKSKL